MLFLALLALAAPVGADQEAGNRPTVTSSKYGNCYAKSVPSHPWEDEGRTYIYRVEAGPDQLVGSYEWFAATLWLECNVSANDGPVGTSVVRLGRWPRGREANRKTLAIAFYRDGKLLRSYSTLDIAGRPDNVSASVSHYTVIEEVLGYSIIESNRNAFTVRTIDSRVLRFDAGTGVLISP